LRRDHIDIVKFKSPQDDDYRTVVTQLREIIWSFSGESQSIEDAASRILGQFDAMGKPQYAVNDSPSIEPVATPLVRMPEIQLGLAILADPFEPIAESVSVPRVELVQR
jgi:hypothetical protein